MMNDIIAELIGALREIAQEVRLTRAVLIEVERQLGEIRKDHKP